MGQVETITAEELQKLKRELDKQKASEVRKAQPVTAEAVRKAQPVAAEAVRKQPVTASPVTSDETTNKNGMTAAKSKCQYSEGDNFAASGKYLMWDTCNLHGNVETVNKDCTKAKIRVSKVTGAFGMQVDAKCRITGTEGAAGDTIWVPLNN